jgi:AmiR/NasT family two-component response regulator
MLLAYEWEGLLQRPENREVVQRILEQLDQDLLTAEEIKRNKTLVRTLKDLGETELYNRLKG